MSPGQVTSPSRPASGSAASTPRAAGPRRGHAAREAVRAFLAAQGHTDADERTITLLTCVDGLVFDRLINGGPVTEKEIAAVVTAALH
ncbi:hypothetical protein [Streptomyces sp. NPDC052494]|uniref:hypothetical protein n=1 Tax=Streptomyces sp. NPDC052494 TaxID=3365692 RepID=UPI0037D90E03